MGYGEVIGWFTALFIWKNDLVIYGTITSDLSASSGIYIEANLIDIESTGKILASAESEESFSGEIHLGHGADMTNLIINRGTIEAKGFGSGSGGHVYCQAKDLIVNHGTIDVSGGDNAFGLFTYSTSELFPAKFITNEADVRQGEETPRQKVAVAAWRLHCNPDGGSRRCSIHYKQLWQHRCFRRRRRHRRFSRELQRCYLYAGPAH